MAFKIEVGVSARAALGSLPKFYQTAIIDAVDQQLVHEPLVATRNRKPLTDGVKANFEYNPPIWELRVREYRVFYDVDLAATTVTIRAVRRKPQGTTTAEVLNEGNGS